MTLDDKKVVLLRYLLEGGLITITIDDTLNNVSSKEVVGLKGNDFGVCDGEDIEPVDITLKQFLCLAESITEEELSYLIVGQKINDKKDGEEIWN